MMIESKEKKAINAKDAKEEDAKGAKKMYLLCVLGASSFASFAVKVFP
jgi:hypothetical protein